MIPVDGEHSRDGADVVARPTFDADGSSQSVSNYAASLESSSHFLGVEGESAPIKAPNPSKPPKPEVNWLVVLGEG